MDINEARVNKSREDRDIGELVTRLIDSGGFNVKLPGKDIFEEFRHLVRARLSDHEEHLVKNDAGPKEFLSEDEKEIQADRRAQCAWAHFNAHAGEKFRVALIELASESLGFSDAIYLERCGADEDAINEARPTAADIQQNVLRPSTQRLRTLPLQRRPDRSEWAENNESLAPLTRAHFAIYNSLPHWTYDHVQVYELLRQVIRPMVTNYDDPEGATHKLANEASEIIWDNIAGAAQMMVNTLLTVALQLAHSSFYERNDAPPEIAESARQSATSLKKIADVFLNMWLKAIPLSLRKQGRPRESIGQKRLQQEREEWLQKARDAASVLTIVDKGNVGVKLGYGKSREGLKPNKAAAQKAMRDKMKKFEVDWADIVPPAEKNRT